MSPDALILKVWNQVVGAARERKHAGIRCKEGRPSDPYKGSSFFISGSILPSLDQFSWNFDSPVLFSVSTCSCFFLLCGNPNTKIQCFFLKAFPRRRIRFFLPEFLFGWKFYLRAAEREGLSGLSLRPVTLKLVSNPSSNTRPLWFPLVLHLSTCVLDLLRQGLGNYAIPISMPRGLAGGKL